MSENAKHALVTRLLDTDGWTSGPELSRALNVSPRSIRNYAKSIPGIESSRLGYRAGPAARAWLERQRNTGPETPLERLYFIVRALLSGEGTVNIFDLCDQLFVAPPTIEADLGRARGLLQGHGLRIRRRGDELQIEGSEDGQRTLLRDLLIDSVATGPVITPDDLQHAFPNYDVQAVRGILQRNLEAQGLRLNPIVESGALLHILITLTRISVGKPLPNSGEISALAAAISDDLQSSLEIEIPESERVYISSLLDQRAGGGEPEDNASELVETALKMLSDEYQIVFDDPALKQSLSLHVRSLLLRASKGTAVPNPFTGQIKQAHPLVYELAVDFARYLGQAANIEIDDDEKAYIAMHLGSYFIRVSPHTDRLSIFILMLGYDHLPPNVAESLRRVLPKNAEIHVVSSLDDVDSQADLLITNIPPTGVRTSVVGVGPFLSQSDLDSVRTRAVALLHDRRVEIFANQLLRLLDPDLFYVDPPARDPEELIRFVSRDLVSLGIAHPNVADSIIERESLSPTGFPSGVAVPHPLKMEAKRSGLAIVSYQEPIDWNGQDVSLVVFIGFSQKERALFNTMFDQLIELLADSDSVQQLAASASDFEAFKRKAVALASAL